MQYQPLLLPPQWQTTVEAVYLPDQTHQVGLLFTGKVVAQAPVLPTPQQVSPELVEVPITLEQETTVQDVGVQLER